MVRCALRSSVHRTKENDVVDDKLARDTRDVTRTIQSAMTNADLVEFCAPLTSRMPACDGDVSAFIKMLMTHVAEFWPLGSRYDFCLQHVGCESIVFGSTNRIIWKQGKGFFMDAGCCTERFVEHFKSTDKRCILSANS
jgi:hypothetical protein